MHAPMYLDGNNVYNNNDIIKTGSTDNDYMYLFIVSSFAGY